MNMRNTITTIVLVTFFYMGCSSGNPSVSHVDSGQSDTSLIQQTASLKPFTPDANWVNPTEIVSQYGPGDICRDVVIDKNGIIWMASWAGVVSYDTGTKQFTNHTLKEGLSH